MVIQVSNTVISNNTIHLQHLANDVTAAMGGEGSGIGNADAVQQNLTALISGVTTFTAPKTFESDLIVQGNLAVEGTTVTANVVNLTVEDPLIVLNKSGTNATAVLGGIVIEGDGGQVIGAIISNVDNSPGWMIGKSNVGLNGVLDGVARWRDFRANDVVTILAAFANDLATFNLLESHIASNAGAGGGNAVFPKHNTNSSTGTSNVFFIALGGNNVSDVNYIQLFLDGVAQYPSVDFIYNSGNNTVQITDPSVPAAINVHITTWTT